MGIAPASISDLGQLDFDPPSAQGAIYFKATDSWTALAPGSFGDVLRSGGVGANPAWIASPGGGDMLAAIYDPSAVAADAFDFVNMDTPGAALGDLLVRFVGGWGRLVNPSGPTIAGRVLTNLGTGYLSWVAPTGDMLAATYDPGGFGFNVYDLSKKFITGQTAGDLYFHSGGGFWSRLPVGAPGQVLVVDGGALPAWATATLGLPANHVDALNLSVSTAATVQIGLGACRDDANGVDIEVTAPITVDVTAAGAGGLDTGVEAASTFYDVYVIADALGGSPDGLLVVRGGVPVMPVGFTTKRRIGTVRNGLLSNFRVYMQTGGGRDKTYIYVDTVVGRLVLVGGSATVPTVVSLAALVPNTTQLALIGIRQTSNPLVDIYQDIAGPVLGTFEGPGGAAALMPTNASQAMGYANQAGGGSVNIAVRGYVETI